MESKTSSGAELSQPKLLASKSDTQGVPGKIDVIKAGEPTPISGLGPEGSADRDEWAYNIIVLGMKIYDSGDRELGRVRSVHREKNLIDVDTTTEDKGTYFRPLVIPLSVIKEVVPIENPDPNSTDRSFLRLKVPSTDAHIKEACKHHIDEITD